MAIRCNAHEGYTSTTGPLTPPYTVVFWGRLASDRDQFQTFWSLAGASAANLTLIQTLNDGVTLKGYGTAGELTGPVMAVGTWYRIGLVRDGTAVSLYTGIATGSLTVTSIGNLGSHTPVTAMSIGHWPHGTVEWLDGDMAGVKMWNAVLTTTEVEAEFTQLRAVRTTNCQRDHPFEVAETTDYSGAGNTLTILGTPTTSTGPPGIPLFVGPTVNAGADATAERGFEFTRTATESPAGETFTSRAWSVVSGPAQVGATLSTAAALSWTPGTNGAYVLRYTATYATGSATDDVTVTVIDPVYLELVGVSAPVFGTTSVNVSAPAGTADGDHLFMVVAAKGASLAVPGVPAGWTQIHATSTGTGTAGAGTGPIGLSLFYRTVPTGGLGTFSVTHAGGTGAVMGVAIAAFRADSGTEVSYGYGVASDTNNNTPFTNSAAFNLDPGFQAGDLVLLNSAMTGTSVAFSTPTLTIPGTTVDTVTEQQDATTATGNDLTLGVHTSKVLTGPSTGLPTWSVVVTGTANRTGGMDVVRVRATLITQIVTPLLLTNTAVVGQPALVPGSVTVSPEQVSSTTTTGRPTVVPGAVTLAAAAVASTAIVRSPTIVSGAVTLAPAPVSSVTAIGHPALVPGVVTVAPQRVAPAAAVGEPVLATTVTVAPQLVSSTATVGEPDLIGEAILAVEPVASTATVGQPTLVAGPVAVAPQWVPGTATVGEPTLVTGAVVIAPETVESTAVVGEPVVLAAGTLAPELVASTATVGQPAITTGPVTLEPAAVASTAAVGQPTVTPGAAVLTPERLDGAAAVGAPLVILLLEVIRPAPLGSTATVGMPIVGIISGVSGPLHAGPPILVGGIRAGDPQPTAGLRGGTPVPGPGVRAGPPERA